METKYLKYLDENGMEKSAEIIFETTINGRDYAIYALDSTNELVDLLAARIITNEDGTVDYVDLDENDDKDQINEVIESLING